MLQNVTYNELHADIREIFESQFATVFVEHPEALDYVKTLSIDFKPKGSQGQDAEYFKDSNKIEWYALWRGYSYDVKRTERPEDIRFKIIDKYLNRTIVHELIHSLQNYFRIQNKQHAAVAPYPDEDHPEYRQYKDVYKNDPGEIQAKAVADNFKFKEDRQKWSYY